MSTRLLFDENFGKPIVRALGELLKWSNLEIEVTHLIDFEGRAGSRDDTWVPKLQEQDYMVITADKGRRGGGPKLPRICKEFGIRHVVLVGKLVHRTMFERVRALLVVWPSLIRVDDAPRGTTFRLKLSGDSYALESDPSR
ncbi:MAG: hypothetical protein JXO22_10850 [Phycisphaerae bacterium]|nr:hypothetical protein [Phycisphaerae bacterium]